MRTLKPTKVKKRAGEQITKEAVAQQLRRQIVLGELPPGSRLPTHSTLVKRFDTTKVTIQRACDVLLEDGFISTQGRRGTFVSQAPPHLTRYAIVFPSSPNLSVGWNNFYQALRHEAPGLEEPPSRFLPLYFGVDGHENSEDYQRLVREVRSHRVAGIIFASGPFQLRHTPLLDEPNIPRVALASHEFLAHVPAIYPDVQSFAQKALDFFKARGRKRLAIILPPGLERMYGSEAPGTLLRTMEQAGFITHPYWRLRANLETPELVREYAHLLFHAGQKEYPDALLIADDNFVPHATAGVLDAGRKVGKQLDIIAHCNFPHPTPSNTPVSRLGFDAREVLAACIRNIDRQRAGGPVESQLKILARFESEVDYASALK